MGINMRLFILTGTLLLVQLSQQASVLPVRRVRGRGVRLRDEVAGPGGRQESGQEEEASRRAESGQEEEEQEASSLNSQHSNDQNSNNIGISFYQFGLHHVLEI